MKRLAAILVLMLVTQEITPQVYLPHRRKAFRSVGGGTTSHVEIQGSGAWFGGSGTSKQVTITAAAGNLLVLGVGWGNAQNISSVTDNQGNTWTLIDHQDATGSASTYYAKNVAAGSTTITIAFGADPGFGTAICHEVAGASTTAPLDVHTIQSQFNPGTGANAVTSGAVSTTANGAYIFGFTFDVTGGAGTYAAGTGFTGLTDGGEGAAEYQVQSSSGSIAATFTYSVTFQDQITAVATFKP